MAQINNREVLRRIEKDCFTSPAAEKVPDQLSDVVVPVVIANPSDVSTFVKQNSKTSSGSLTVFTTDSTKETYLTAVHFGMVKDSTNNASTGITSLSVFIDEAQVNLINIPIITTTTQEQNVVLCFTKPLKVDKNTAVSFSNTTYAAGTMIRSANITGYTVDPQ